VRRPSPLCSHWLGLAITLTLSAHSCVSGVTSSPSAACEATCSWPATFISAHSASAMTGTPLCTAQLAAVQRLQCHRQRDRREHVRCGGRAAAAASRHHEGADTGRRTWRECRHVAAGEITSVPLPLAVTTNSSSAYVAVAAHAWQLGRCSRTISSCDAVHVQPCKSATGGACVLNHRRGGMPWVTVVTL